MLWKSLQTGWIDWEGSIIRETAVFIYLAFQLFWKIILNVAAHWFAKWPIMTSKAQSLFSKGVKKKKINLYHTWDKNTLFLSLKGQFTLNWKGSSYLQSLATTLVENVGNVRCHGVRRLDAGEIKIKSPKKKQKKHSTNIYLMHLNTYAYLVIVAVRRTLPAEPLFFYSTEALSCAPLVHYGLCSYNFKYF